MGVAPTVEAFSKVRLMLGSQVIKHRRSIVSTIDILAKIGGFIVFITILAWSALRSVFYFNAKGLNYTTLFKVNLIDDGSSKNLNT